MELMFPLRGYPPDTALPFGDLNVEAFCAEEVRRQGDTQWHVFRMLDAWRWAQRYIISSRDFADDSGDYPPLSHSIIRNIGLIVDEINVAGYRNGIVHIGGRVVSSVTIYADMNDLLAHQDAITPIQFYGEFERIHPFFDGNGRTGKILYNWKNKTMWEPVWPIDLFGGIENP